MVTPLLVLWNAWRHASFAFACAEEPTPFRVPERLPPELLLLDEEEAPELPCASWLAQEVRASPTVTAAPIAMLVRECFKFFLPKDWRCVRSGGNPVGPDVSHAKERRL